MRRVVVLGGGFCGLDTILQLQDIMGSRRVELVLVEPNPQFVFTPLLTDVASGITPAHRATVPYRQILDDERVRWLRDRAVGLDANDQILHLEDNGRFDFDSLVITVGSRVLPDPEVVADPADVFTMKTLEDALRLRSFLSARLDAAHIVIVGGGCVGVELAAALLSQEHSGSATISHGTRVTLIEAGSRLLPDMDEGLSAEAYRALAGWGANIELSETVARVEGHRLELASGRTIEGDLVVWAGGVVAGGFAASTGLDLTDDGRIIVEDDLRVPGAGELYAAGDVAWVDSPHGEPPRRIEVALKQARLVAGNVNAGMIGRARASYQYQPGVEVVDLGGRRAAAIYQGVLLRGRMAWGVRHLALASMAPSLAQKLALATDLGASILKRSARLFGGSERSS